MTTIELSRPAANPTETVGLVIDEKALRKNLRYAFSNYFTVVQELLQNARRAGATRIAVEYDDQDKRLVVEDDGSGLKNFSVLLRYAASGWSDDVAAAELPYGMGFLAAVYSAREVLVVSGAWQLRFDSAALLDGAVFPIEQAPVPVNGTRLELYGVDLPEADQVLERMAKGYPVPITFNGRDLRRDHAVTHNGRTFIPTDVGLISVPPTCPSADLHVYLQGLQVYTKISNYWTGTVGATVVHLDSAKWRGNFPDRNKCIDEEIMVRAVKAALRLSMERRLLDLKSSLSPADFCETAYELANWTNRLDVFNDIDLAPASWFGQLAELPYAELDGNTCLESAAPEGTVFTRAQFESGELVAAELESGGFPAWYSSNDEGPAPQLAWMLAYRMGAKVLKQELDDAHWLYGLLRFNEDSAISVEVVAPGKAAQMPFARTNRIGGIAVQLCAKTTLELDGVRIDVDEPWIGEADDQLTLFVPTGRYVSEYVLRQNDDYLADGIYESDELDADEREVNQFLRELTTEEPRERLQLALRAALDDYRASVTGFSTFTVDVDEHGGITVVAAVERKPANAEGSTPT
jgi:hypothetical protein